MSLKNKIIKGRGNSNANIMIIGEAPGATEIKQNAPFVGPSGKVLDSWLKELGLTRNDVWITNLIKVKLPKNRRPTKKEINKWGKILEKEIENINPIIIVTLGECTTKTLLPFRTKLPLNTLIGNAYVAGLGSYIVPMYHPAYCVRFKNKSEQALSHIKHIQELIYEVLNNFHVIAV